MIAALVQIRLPKPVSRDAARETFLSTAPKYREVKGLVRKHYILSQDGTTAGGVYIWTSKADAELLYTQEWRAFILEKYGTLPSVTYFENPVIVDNVSGDIISDDI